jgi:hypothetical protein
MVTSRALLHLPGEREFSVMPLPTPLESADADELSDYPVRPLFATVPASISHRPTAKPSARCAVAWTAFRSRWNWLRHAHEYSLQRKSWSACSNASTFCRDVKWAWRRAIARCAPPSSGAPIY